MRGYPEKNGALGLIALTKPRKGRPRIEDRANTTEAQKPWLAKGMSRSTWYRIQKDPERKKALNNL